MKKIIIGCICVLFCVILYGTTIIPVSVAEYDSNLGMFETILNEIGEIPLFISFLIFTGGIYYFFMGMKEIK